MAQDKVIVKFTKRHPPYNAGEIAGVRPEAARDLFVRLIAEPTDGDWRGVNVPRKGIDASAARAAQDARPDATEGEAGAESTEGAGAASGAAGGAEGAKAGGELAVDAEIAAIVEASVPDILRWAKREDVDAVRVVAVYEAEIQRERPRSTLIEALDAEIKRREAAAETSTDE